MKYTIKLQWLYANKTDHLKEYGDILMHKRNYICLESEHDVDTLASLEGVEDVKVNIIP